ncbi:hypothetical protein [Saccharibacillus deserti]|uniref:hypothetical protein n=1 Tax=Saccharibacillus deserti TaxID=1634444 RepID=UPI001553E50A|nr:hypothetical protein [Saccharibacillus deserti]
MKETERSAVKRKLDEELKLHTFAGQEAVLKRTHPAPRRTRLHALWNRELEWVLNPASLMGGTAALLLLAALPVLSYTLQSPHPAAGQRELIEVGGSIYWSDTYRNEVDRLEN